MHQVCHVCGLVLVTIGQAGKTMALRNFEACHEVGSLRVAVMQLLDLGWVVPASFHQWT